jgi:hypothetical protein
MTTVAGARGRLPMRWQPHRHVTGGRRAAASERRTERGASSRHPRAHRGWRFPNRPRPGRRRRDLRLAGRVRRRRLDDRSGRGAGRRHRAARVRGDHSGPDRGRRGRARPRPGAARRDHAAARALRAGIGYIPEDRQAEGFVPLLGAAENIVMTITDRIARFGFVGPGAARRGPRRWPGGCPWSRPVSASRSTSCPAATS